MDTTKLTPFGMCVRKLRIDHQERLKDMAERLDISASYLSSVEHGRRIVPATWVEQLQDFYDLDVDEIEALESAVTETRLQHHNKVDVSHLSNDDKTMLGRLAKKLPKLDKTIRKRLLDIVGD